MIECKTIYTEIEKNKGKIKWSVSGWYCGRILDFAIAYRWMLVNKFANQF